MSLINDALRRAQSDVDTGRMKPVSVSLTGAPPRSNQKSSFLKILTVVLILGIGGWAVALFIVLPTKNEESAPAAISSVPPSSEPLQPEVNIPVVEAVVEMDKIQTEVAVKTPANPETTEPEETVVPPVSSVEEPATSLALEAQPVASPSEGAPAPPVAVKKPTPEPLAQVAEPVAQLSLNDEIIFTLKQLDITAVMGEGKNARIMMDGQIHKAGELINLDLKIRFYGKKGSLLFFTDEKGQLYEKDL